MNKNDAIEFLKNNGLGSISVSTLDRHRKEGRIQAGEVRGKTGMVVDFPEEALQAYLEAELPPSPSIVKPVDKPSSLERLLKPTQALAKVSHQFPQGEIQKVEAFDEAHQGFAKPLMDLRQLAVKTLWTIDEAVASTGVSKGTIKAAIKDGKVKGGLDGSKLKVNAEDARRFASELF